MVTLKKKMSDKQKLMAFVLSKDEDFGYPMKKIGELMDVSTTTISTSIKEVKFQKEIYDLKQQLIEAKKLAEMQYGKPRINPLTFEEDHSEKKLINPIIRCEDTEE